MAGYSETPLAKKLGIKEGFRLGLVNAPKGFKKKLGSLPAGVKISVGQLPNSLDLIILFTDTSRTLKLQFPMLAERLNPNGMLWVAWPKKSSGVSTDLSFNIVQHTGLAAGLVDAKICAVDDTWSGLKFVYRLKDRKSRL
ncbi:MAG TPA: hypothetical protein VMS31_03505 [Pyrinomonadaceae bacterium]|nr:hypothetical protein [Pyrinomonadaceae bacterium]